ncbi:probable E3 ubiquitin-protein ligase DDB_G0283893 [Linepithema humile]|uniref:probable E3 ubiquitin-protein ligase DDB_G0283893 n=1 Tax=Linepithema humile TaxID=83485 RepID=UPI00351F2D0D
MGKLQRPTRPIKKPLRYVTTSSDQAPTLKRKPRTNNSTGGIDDDINSLRNIFQENEEDERDEEYEEDKEDEEYEDEENIEDEEEENEEENEENKKNKDVSSHTHTFRDIDTHKNINLHPNVPRKTYSLHVPFSASQNTSLKNSQNRAKIESRVESTTSQGLKPIDSYRKIQDRFDSVETQLKKMNTLLEHISKRIQEQKGIPRKPSVLPISSCSEMDAFERADDKIYCDVVTYFGHIGGFHPKEAINLCFKEGIKDSITSSFTWWGRNQNHRSLYNARLTMAIYEAVCNNEHFSKPTRTDFQRHIREALRTAKERQRHKERGRKQTVNRPREQNFWNDELEETEERLNEMC